MLRAAAGVKKLPGYQHMLEFDQSTLQGKITPAFASETMNLIDNVLGGGAVSYSGSDCRAIIEVADAGASQTDMPRLAKQLLELTTITVSVHRVKSPVPAGGFINTKGFARGRRTIAGTMILTKFTAEVLFRFLQSSVFKDLSKDSHYMKIDQLPPFNISLLFCNENGYASYQRILGVEFVTDGSVYSVQDMLSEQTISYMASDFTPLAPLTFFCVDKPGVFLLWDTTTPRARARCSPWAALRGFGRPPALCRIRW